MYSTSEILNYMRENGRIDIGTICDEMEKEERKQILAGYYIWQGEKDKRWYTYFQDDKKGRVLKSRKTRKEIEDLVVKNYEEAVNKPCYREVFEMWITEKEEFDELAPSSLSRYRNDFIRFFPKSEPFCKVRLCDMDDSIMERFIKRTIRDKKLTVKSYAGLRTLIIGVFKYAKREKYTDYSIMAFFRDFSLPKSIFTRPKKDKNTEVFSIDELSKMVSYLAQHQTTINLAILFQIYTGLRVGELVALKPEDNKKKYYLSISRTEYNYYDKQLNKRKMEVKDFPKTENSIRTIVIPKKAQHVLDILKLRVHSDDFLFTENGKRVTSKQVNYHLHKVCEEIEIQPRSTHKIRRSYASKLLSERVDAAIIQNQMGHKQITTTEKYYHYDISEDDVRLEKIDQAINFD